MIYLFQINGSTVMISIPSVDEIVQFLRVLCSVGTYKISKM